MTFLYVASDFFWYPIRIEFFQIKFVNWLKMLKKYSNIRHTMVKRFGFTAKRFRDLFSLHENRANCIKKMFTMNLDIIFRLVYMN